MYSGTLGKTILTLTTMVRWFVVLPGCMTGAHCSQRPSETYLFRWRKPWRTFIRLYSRDFDYTRCIPPRSHNTARSFLESFTRHKYRYLKKPKNCTKRRNARWLYQSIGWRWISRWILRVRKSTRMIARREGSVLLLLGLTSRLEEDIKGSPLSSGNDDIRKTGRKKGWKKEKEWKKEERKKGKKEWDRKGKRHTATT